MKGKPQRKKKGAGILVNDVWGLYTAYLPDREVPPGWRISEGRQRTFVLKNYSYILPNLAGDNHVNPDLTTE